jgi:hypothetical protein
MTSELVSEDRIALRDALDKALDDDSMKTLKKKASDLTQEIVDHIEWSLKDNLAEGLSWHVAQMAERAIESLLSGNESEMIRWLKSDKRGYNGRSDGYTGPNSPIEGQHPIIHGLLHENQCVALRRKIFEAHRDLIVSERIADLEDEVKSLIAQVNKTNREKEAMWERVRAAEGNF